MRVLAGLAIAFALLAGGELAASAFGRPTLLLEGSRTVALQAWLLEALAFVAVARLLVGRAGVVLDGLVLGGVLWVARWPLLALSLVQLGVAPRLDWTQLVRDRLLLDLLVGMVLAWLFRREREEQR
jgi:hypothetical protein